MYHRNRRWPGHDYQFRFERIGSFANLADAGSLLAVFLGSEAEGVLLTEDGIGIVF